MTNSQAAVSGSQDFSVIIMLEAGTYTIRAYDLSKMLHQFSDTIVTEPQKGLIRSKAKFEMSDTKVLDMEVGKKKG